MSFALTLCDKDPRMVEAWRRHFQPDTGVTVVLKNLLTLDCDTLVVPANSFGFTDGGMDLAISKFFDWELQERVREVIDRECHGELLVGEALVVSTGSERFPNLIVAPTMRVPMDVKDTVNAYLAMRGVLLAALHHNRRYDLGIRATGMPPEQGMRRISGLAISGLGTGVGGMPPTRAAYQMWVAYRSVVLREAFHDDTLDARLRRHEEMRTY